MSKDFALWFPYCDETDMWVESIYNNETKERFVENLLESKKMAKTHSAIVVRISEVSMQGEEYDFCCYLGESGKWVARRIDRTLLPTSFSIEAKIKDLDLMTINCTSDQLSTASVAAWATKTIVKQICDKKSSLNINGHSLWSESEVRKGLQKDFSYLRIIQGERQYTFHFPAMLFDSKA